MKDKIILLVIGILVGAVIATGAFFVYTKAKSCDCSSNNVQMNGGTPPSMPSGENGQPPEMPSGNNDQTNKS